MLGLCPRGRRKVAIALQTDGFHTVVGRAHEFSRGRALALTRTVSPAQPHRLVGGLGTLYGKGGEQEMKKLMQWLRRQKGQDLTEYALIIGLIVLLAIVALQTMGSSIQQILDKIATALGKAVT